MSITEQLLIEIRRAGSTRRTIADIYAAGIGHAQEYEFVDWPTVKKALLKRYSVSGLLYIKALAWKRWAERHPSKVRA